MSGGLVGNAAARATRGGSSGVRVAVLTGDPSVRAGLAAALVGAAPGCRLTVTEGLAGLAALAAEGSGPLVVVDGSVRLEAPALLDLLDRPDDRTTALVVDPNNLEAPRQTSHGRADATVARVGPDAALLESSGSAVHRVGAPNRLRAGVLRVAEADRAAAARCWDSAAAQPGLDTADRFDLALVALLRAGVPTAARPLGFYRWERGTAGQSGAEGSAWRQRLRTASRGGDGFYSFAVVRRLSRHGTALGLRLGWSPNAVTAASLLIGLAAAALVWTGRPWAWVLAAVLLQLALVVDCMDGEIARFTRRFSAFGGWLDGIGDRIKEYAVFAAAAAVAVREGHPSGWLLAVIAMVLVTGRHLEDHSYTDKLADLRRSRPERLDLASAADGAAAAGSSLVLPAPPDRRARTVFWAKKVVHLPIAERYLLLSVLLLTQQPIWLLSVSVAANALALGWALGGRILRELRRPLHPTATEEPSPSDRWALDHQLDLGPLARLIGLLGRGPFALGVVGFLLAALGVITCLCAGLGPLALGGALLVAVIIGATCRAPVRQRFGWLLPPVLWATEAAVAAALLAHGTVGGPLFAFLATCAYRRYDLIYSVRAHGGPAIRAPGWTIGLGVEGRMIGIAVLLTVVLGLGPVPPGAQSAALAAGLTEGLRVGLLVGVLLVGVPAVSASAREWRPSTSTQT